MKKIIVVLAFAIVPVLLSGCGEEEIAQLSELQQRDGVYVVPKTQKPYSGKFVTSYENNAIKEDGSLKKGKRHGEVKNYDENGQLIWTAHYEDGIIGPFTDSRDGKSYKIIKIGSQTWFAENLNYEASDSKCYGNDPSNCQKYGRLYDWNTALKSCPSGWHLPSNEEWDELYHFVDGTSGAKNLYKSETAGKLLKATNGWNSDGNGTDGFGFSALPGGYGNSYGDFSIVGNHGYWWSANERKRCDSAYGSYYHCDEAYYRGMSYNDEIADWNSSDKDRFLYSVRCTQD